MNWRYNVTAAMRIVLLTLNVVLLLVILVESYINATWDTVRVLMIAVSAVNILYFTGNKPRNPETKNADIEIPRETPPRI
jgi:hypothetical protein